MKQDQRLKKITNIVWVSLAVLEVIVICVLWAYTDNPGWLLPFIAFGYIFLTIIVIVVAVNATYEAVLEISSFISKLINKYKD